MPEKILINLLSEQKLPNFIAVMHLLPDRVITLTTKDFKAQVHLFEQATATSHVASNFSPYNFMADISSLQALIREIPVDTDLVINFTGGTKIMSVATVLGSIAESSTRTIRLIYVDTAENQIQRIQVGPNRRITSLKPENIAVQIPAKAFLSLSNEKLLSCIESPNSSMLARAPIASILQQRQCISLFSKQNQINDKSGNRRKDGAITFRDSSKKRDGKLTWNPKQATLQAPSGELHVIEGEDAVAFFAGSWLEEITFESLYISGRFHSLLLNAKLDLSERIKNILKQPGALKTELDIVATKGLRAAVIECKAGRVTQEHIFRLAALRDQLFGTFGVAILVSLFPPSPTVQEKATDHKVNILSKNAFSSLPERVEKLLVS
jgi:hypothetical protein